MSDARRRLQGLKELLVHGVEQGSRQVERIQRGVIDLPFALLEQVPAIAEPVKAVHDAERFVTSATWKVVRVSARVVGLVADVALAVAGPAGDRVAKLPEKKPDS